MKIIPPNATLLPHDAKKVFSGVIFDIFQWQQQMFDDSYETFEMLRRPDTVQVICIHNNKVVVLEEEQPHVGKRVNFTGGRVDSGDEDIEAAAHREVREETGLSFRNLKLIHVEQPFAKMEWFVYTYIASDFSGSVRPELDAGERIKLTYLTISEVQQMLLTAKLKPFVTGEVDNLLMSVVSVEELLDIPEYQGKVYEA